MPRKGRTEEQMIYALRQAEAGKKGGDICREIGVSPQAFHSWKRKFAGLALNEVRELRFPGESFLHRFVRLSSGTGLTQLWWSFWFKCLMDFQKHSARR